jgi:hypothetical protein
MAALNKMRPYLDAILISAKPGGDRDEEKNEGI